MERVDYSIYPSLLIAYQNLLDYEKVAEEAWNKVSEAAHNRGEYLYLEIGDYKLTPDEMYFKLECDLIDSINRVEHEYGEATSKGVAFNEIVDCLIENRKSNLPDCNIYSTKNELGISVIRAEIGGFIFDYDIDLCRKVARDFKGSLTQYFADSTIATQYGNVRLYGYIDEWCGNKMYDIKTTGSYSWGKFKHGWQRYVYPYCVVNAGDTTEVESFTYYVVEWAYHAKGQPITAKEIYKESYDYDHAICKAKIQEMLESFLSWLAYRKEYIQDKRIYGGQNPEGWHGTPINREEFITKQIVLDGL